ncbi:lactate racemase domain-containing protein [Paludisphaera rhizosphaerae]|uniref:lactate racemase domain-containing protein n=1 Tax=Paludisphaera rhizosphaerae TaxID=2711216 RepID=UPI0013EAC7C2|nr:lactate racemase domain-containing protein [Paludisphaera rhizosphaerae]
MPWISERAPRIDDARLAGLMAETVAEARRRICEKPRRVLLLPPDITRAHSGAGKLTEILYRAFAPEAEVRVIPTLGQHVPHTPEQNRFMFGSIPEEHILVHDWRDGCVVIGEVPADFVREVSGGAADWAIPVSLNKTLIEEPWDLIINVGHVVPHEVLGFANHNKNYFIGLGGKDLICASHMMAASCGIENNLGQLITPLRACFNKAEDELLGRLPDLYVQIVMARGEDGELTTTGIHVGDDLETYLAAARQSREQNITVFDKPVSKIVCVMQEDEFASTWVANKAVYRTRMALADDGELIILAPGLVRFGEQPDVDALIRRVGYVGTPRVMAQYPNDPEMQDLAHATAHLLHGSSEGRFRITYAPGHLTREEIEGVNFGYTDLADAIARYRPSESKEGWNRTEDGEDYFFIPTPSAGLWMVGDRLAGR